MNTTKATCTPLYYIDSFCVKTGNLLDVSEEGYATIELCQAQIDAENKQDKEFEHELLEQYEENLKNFVLDIDTSDREPINPISVLPRYKKTPHLYFHDERGHHEIHEYFIKGIDTLNYTVEQAQMQIGIFNETIDPESFESVKKWVSQCYSKPSSDELKMCAMNEILGGYGIESIRTTKWKNGYWCDILCTYVNMGDPCIPTVIHHRKHGFMIASIGDIIEKNKHVI